MIIMSESRESNIDGTLHISGECCNDSSNELRCCSVVGCQGTVHTQSTTFGLVMSCDTCASQSRHWLPRGTYGVEKEIS